MGILEFVFGKSAPKDDTQGTQAFYLSDDDAKTFGNIDYMRSSKVVKRTFAKKKGQEHLESVKQISALDARSVDDGGFSTASQSTSAASTSSEASVPQNASVAKSKRRTSRSGDMDMFRDMAKGMRK